jgi:hypothetical protein
MTQAYTMTRPYTRMRSAYLLGVVALLSLGACNKKIGLSPITMSIGLANARSTVADTLVFNLGDTCKFTISGYADNLAVYTGDAGHKYVNRNRDTADGIPELSFSSTEQYGTQTNTLQVLATDKLPNYDSATVVNAGWTDITGMATLATSTTVTPSGSINLSGSVNSPDDSLFIAFKYTGVAGSTQRTWTITNFQVTDLLPDEAAVISDLALDSKAFYALRIAPSTATWAVTTTQIQEVGGNATAPNNVCWIVTKPLYLNVVSPDLSVGIKNVAGALPTSYTYKYAAVGTYLCTFVLFNDNVDQQQSEIKQFYIKVE